MKISFNITIKSYPPCRDYLKLTYNHITYFIDEFSRKYKTSYFSLEPLLEKCEIIYREKHMLYSQMISEGNKFSKELHFPKNSKNVNELNLIMIKNQDYYNASQYLKKAEECLQTARYYLLRAYDKLYLDYNINWSYGYIPQYNIRCMNFKTAVVWYNNCFDYLLLIVFFAYRLYEKMKKYKKGMVLEEILGLCTYRDILNLFLNDKCDQKLKLTWENIIDPCYNELEPIRTWANYIKHRGGIVFEGEKSDCQISIENLDSEGNVIAKTKDFDPIKLDLDESIETLSKFHNVLLNCINRVVSFMALKEVSNTENNLS